jgi:hypothetical protein
LRAAMNCAKIAPPCTRTQAQQWGLLMRITRILVTTALALLA